MKTLYSNLKSIQERVKIGEGINRKMNEMVELLREKEKVIDDLKGVLDRES